MRGAPALLSLCLTAVAVAGCASTVMRPAQPSANSPDRQLMVVLRPMHPDLWPRTAGLLAAAYGMQPLAGWEMRSISSFCVIYRLVPPYDIATLIQHLQADSRVALVEPRQAFHLLAAPESGDPYAHLQNGANTIHVAAAHRYADGRGVQVAIIDTGVDFTHPDLAGRVTGAVNFVDDGTASFTSDRHGTAIAGIVAADEGNRIGIVGVAPRADLLALKACREKNAGQSAQCDTYTLALALDYAILHHAQVINLSLAGPRDSLLQRLIEAAMEQGITVVAAVDPTLPGSLSFPASVPGVIAVAEKDARPNADAGSRRRSGVVTAPGFEILTTQPDGRFDFLSGSSMAAAHASGIAALLLQLDSTLSPARVAALMHGADGPTVKANAYADEDDEVDACAAVVRLRGDGDCGPDVGSGGSNLKTDL